MSIQINPPLQVIRGGGETSDGRAVLTLLSPPVDAAVVAIHAAMFPEAEPLDEWRRRLS